MAKTYRIRIAAEKTEPIEYFTGDIVRFEANDVTFLGVLIRPEVELYASEERIWLVSTTDDGLMYMAADHFTLIRRPSDD